MAQLDAIRHEIRSISIINPGPMTRSLVDNIDPQSISDGIISATNFGHTVELTKFFTDIAEIVYNGVLLFCILFRQSETRKH